MLNPGLKEFKEIRKSGDYSRVTFYREIVGDMFTPMSLVRNFSNEKYLFILESANLDKSFSRYSFFGYKPEKVIRFKDGTVHVEKGGKKESFQMNPMDYLSQEFRKDRGYNDGRFGDFSGGFVGYFGYDCVNYMNVLRDRLKESEKEDILGFFHVNEFYVFDNHVSKLYAACSIQMKGTDEEVYEKAMKRTEKMASELHKLNFDGTDSVDQFEIKKEYEKEEFVKKVEAIKKEITDGEAIQVVFSNRYEINGQVNAVNFYRALRNVNPSPYMFFLKFNDYTLCGSSPEIHLKIRDRKAILKPIAGTYPISPDVEADKKALLEDKKELSEHLMLLDLARNDLYAGCKPETVKVTESFIPEVYSHVIHIVSVVEGELEDGTEPLDTFMKTFPAGTVSGAPKVRAMEIIDQFEESCRGFYAGCVGYFGYSGNIDTCITIRSALVKKDKTILRAGAGIVYDSVPEKEFAEVENKLGALFKAFESMKNLEEKNVFAR